MSKNLLNSDMRTRLEQLISKGEFKTKSHLARKIGLASSTFRDIWRRGYGSKKNIKKIKDYLDSLIILVPDVGLPSNEKITKVEDIGKVSKRVEKLKYLLWLVEIELQEFKNSPEEREILRKQLDINDIGYVASFLMMICDEQGFKRWLAMNRGQFKSFRGNVNEQ